MNVVLWILAGLLAVAFLGAGLTKVFQPKEKLAATMGIVPVLVPLAAVGLVALMIGAALTHARRKETPMIVANLVLLVLAAVVVWGRFGPYSFSA